MDILDNEYSDLFDEIRRNLVKQSYFKYGPASQNFGDHRVNALISAELCVKKYKETHNTEYLADAANYMMFEFMYPSSSSAYFKYTDESAGVAGLPINESKNFTEEHSYEDNF